MYYYINDKFVNSNDAAVPFSDGGFLYGDGLFETMRFDNRQIFLPLKHLSRLNRGLKLINLTINKTADELLDILKAVIKKNTLDSGIIRLMVTRGITENKIERDSASANISITFCVTSYFFSNGNVILLAIYFQSFVSI